MKFQLRGEEFEYLMFYATEKDTFPITFPLLYFAYRLMNIRPNGVDWVNLRTKDTHERLLMSRNSTSRGVLKSQLLTQIGDSESIWLVNPFPYDNFTGKNLKHMVLWCNPKLFTGAIGSHYMRSQLDVNFRKSVVFAFENGPGRKSIEYIPHAHAIIHTLQK